MDLNKCEECGHDLSSNVDFVDKTGCCPNCGEKLKINISINKTQISLIILFIITIIVFYGLKYF
jgi:hypothetical protein